MKFLSREKLSQHKYKTPEGYLVCVDAILARTGKQTYNKNEVFDCDDASEIEVDRKPEEVFSEKAIASFENKPVVVEHPNEEVNVDNYKMYAVGFVRDVHRGRTANGEDVLLGTLVITDAQTIEEIENGEHTDLSCGYDCDIKNESALQMRNIRGNHVALCQEGRAGIAKIVDGKPNKNKKYRIRFNSGKNEFDTVIIKAENEEAAIREFEKKHAHKIFAGANEVKDFEKISYEPIVKDYYKWQPSKTQRREFAQTMSEIEEFCRQNNISQSSAGDSYYFTINGQKYRVSNHTPEASYRNSGGKWHENGREDDTIYITAGKTRIREIYNDLKAGKKLSARGYADSIDSIRKVLSNFTNKTLKIKERR